MDNILYNIKVIIPYNKNSSLTDKRKTLEIRAKNKDVKYHKFLSFEFERYNMTRLGINNGLKIKTEYDSLKISDKIKKIVIKKYILVINNDVLFCFKSLIIINT